jgi:hypothetical protein
MIEVTRVHWGKGYQLLPLDAPYKRKTPTRLTERKGYKQCPVIDTNEDLKN